MRGRGSFGMRGGWYGRPMMRPGLWGRRPRLWGLWPFFGGWLFYGLGGLFFLLVLLGLFLR